MSIPTRLPTREAPAHGRQAVCSPERNAADTAAATTIVSAGQPKRSRRGDCSPDYFILTKVRDRNQFFAVGGASSGARNLPINRNRVSLEFR